VGMKVGLTRGLGVVGDLPADDAFCYAAGGKGAGRERGEGQ
jgi:hypothetical protein